MKDALTITEEMPEARKQNITEIINTYGQRLLRFIKQRVSREVDAEDILQDVFYQLVDAVEPIEQISGWLFRVAKNKITDQQRKRKPGLFSDIFGEDENGDELEWDDLAGDPDNPETAYLRSIFWETLSAALEELPPEQREVFVLHELEDVSFKEIAIRTGASVNTLLSRKRYAVLHLRERLQVIKDELLNY